jgi:cytochrome c
MQTVRGIGFVGAACAAVLCSTVSLADPYLAKKSGCMKCHNADLKIVGPAYKDVAAKYKGDATALDRLTAKVKVGGGGAWGEVPMPPNAAVSENHIRKIVTWLLSL